MDRESATSEQLSTWDACPWRGRRKPELAAGDLFKLVRETIEDLGSTFLLDLPPLDQGARGRLLHIFEMSRASIVFGFTMKISHMLEPPWLTLAVAHHTKDVAISAIKKVLASDSQHPLVRA